MSYDYVYHFVRGEPSGLGSVLGFGHMVVQILHRFSFSGSPLLEGFSVYTGGFSSKGEKKLPGDFPGGFFRFVFLRGVSPVIDEGLKINR